MCAEQIDLGSPYSHQLKASMKVIHMNLLKEREILKNHEQKIQCHDI
jgi:hypothetical protein